MAEPSLPHILDQIRWRVDAAVDEREADSAGRILDELTRLERPFDEHADPVHITASAVITGERGVILLKHRRLGLWFQPGGHVDAGETPSAAALREATEETGLDVRLVTDEIVHVDVHAGPKGHTHLDLRYLCTAPAADPIPPPEESQDCFWFAWDAAIEMADDGLRGLLVALHPSRAQ